MNEKIIVSLDEATHIYTDNLGRTYQSVSKFLEMFSKKFDREGISKMSAIKAGVSQEEILAQWDKKRDDSIDHGNRIHNAIEQYIRTTEISADNQDLKPMILSIAKDMAQYYRIFPEEIIANQEHLIAGKTDNRLQCTSHKNSVIDFSDFKTNLSKGILYKCPYGKYMLGPLSHLQDCNYNKYSLQISTYAHLYQVNTGAKIGQLSIIFIPPSNPLGWYKIPVPFMKREVEDMLEYRKNNAAETVPTLTDHKSSSTSILSEFGHNSDEF